MKDRIWKRYLLGGALGGAAYYLLPPVAKNGPFLGLLGGSSIVAVLVATRMHRPEKRLPWYLFAAGLALSVTGDVFTYYYASLFHHQIPFPSFGEVFYLAVYLCLIAGILVLVKQRSPGRDRAGLIDSVILTIGVGLLSWEFLMAPYARDVTLSLAVKLTSLAYPMMDVLLLAVLVRLAVGGGRKGPPFYLLVCGAAALLATDAAWGAMQLHGVTSAKGVPLEAGWLSFYLMWGAAALHPDMRRLSEPSSAETPRFNRFRLVLLTGASLMAPLILAIQHFRHESSDLVVILGASIALFLLAMARMSGLVRSHEVTEERERALREAGTSLVAATGRRELYEAAIVATRNLVSPACEIRLAVAPDVEGDFLVVATNQPASAEMALGLPLPAATLAREALPEEMTEAFATRGWFRIDPVSAAERAALGFPAGTRSASLAPLNSGGELLGLLLVAGPGRIPATTALAVSALASQVALALESALLTEDLLRGRSEARFASLVRNSSDVITIIGADTTIRYQSPSISHVLGYEPEPLVGSRFLELIHPEDGERVLRHLDELVLDPTVHPEGIEFRVLHRDGTWREVETLWTDLSPDPEVGGIVLNTRDVTERKVSERQLTHQALHDSITGLANRALFRDRVEHALARQQRDDRPVAVLLMDIDDFKTINDSLGHAAGDLVLAEVGARLKGCLRAADTAARLGGDEFAMLLEDSGYSRAAEVADRVMKNLGMAIDVEGKDVFIRVSIGIAIGDEDRKGGAGADDLLRNADVAMYTAKSAGKSRYQVFEPAMHSAVLKRLELMADLQRAVEKGEFLLRFQPVVVLETGEVAGLEALDPVDPSRTRRGHADGVHPPRRGNRPDRPVG